MRQDSEVVIENVSAKSGAGFFATGNVYISVGHSVRSLPCWRAMYKDANRLIHSNFNSHVHIDMYCIFCDSHGHVAERHVSFDLFVLSTA